MATAMSAGDHLARRPANSRLRHLRNRNSRTTGSSPCLIIANPFSCLHERPRTLAKIQRSRLTVPVTLILIPPLEGRERSIALRFGYFILRLGRFPLSRQTLGAGCSVLHVLLPDFTWLPR